MQSNGLFIQFVFISEQLELAKFHEVLMLEASAPSDIQVDLERDLALKVEVVEMLLLLFLDGVLCGILLRHQGQLLLGAE